MKDKAKLGATTAPLRAEIDVRDCVVEGHIPSDLSGGFYATGPDPQYPLVPGNIPFDGDGHVRMFRIHNGRVDYRSRFVRTERYIAQDRARRPLMPMYRNPALDDPSVKGLSRSTANTHVLNHRNLLLALKEDSPPVALDLNTLETLDPVYTFDGQLPRDMPFSAHPKVCSTTGNIISFGYEAEGFGSDVLAVFEIDPQGRKVWEARVRMPYVCNLHDFAVTEHYVAFFMSPFAMDSGLLQRGGIHWSWDSQKKSYLGLMRRYGDGKDIRWIEGAPRGGSHTLGAFEDGQTLYFDREITAGNQYPFIPNKDGAPFDPSVGASYIHRLSVRLDGNSNEYKMEQMYPLIAGLPRQDDRYMTKPYRYAYTGCPDPKDPVRWKSTCYARMDHHSRSYQLWRAPGAVSLAEPVFAPRRADAPEGQGYLLGVMWHLEDGLRSDLVILDAERINEGPVATVKLPIQASPQIHGWWVREDQYPTCVD